MKNPILSLKEISLSFGTEPLFTKLSLNIFPRDRVCLVGRNGQGKSSLFKVIDGSYEIDSGERWVLPGITVGYLPQDTVYEQNQTTYDFLLGGLGNKKVIETSSYLADILIDNLKLNREDYLNQLSGGLLRRAFLARTLIQAPDLLLLDEPTNHLDIDTIEWLEEYIKEYKGAVVCISHDKAFLRNISEKTFWLDRGFSRINNSGYQDFERWSENILEQEQRSAEKLGKKLSEEEKWKIQGISARRIRNQARLRELYILREKARKDKIIQNQLAKKINHDLSSPQISSKLVFEFKNVSKEHKNTKILESFSMCAMLGDKIGIIGPNGMGKTTFLKLLVGDEKPDGGIVRLGKTVTVTYYDQRRAKLDPEQTLWQALCGDTGDHLRAGGKLIHVVAYLKKFLFDYKTVKDKVSTLSGGQANRLLLAKALSEPGSLLILDEPTNDLDMDTLDMISDILYDYTGTLIIVSHDRDFLNNLTTKTLYFKGNGVIEEFIGGYKDLNKLQKLQAKEKVNGSSNKAKLNDSCDMNQVKLSYSTQRELNILPKKIEDLEKEVAKIELVLATPDFYQKSLIEFNKYTKKLVEIKQELDNLWSRWQELEDIIITNNTLDTNHKNR